jgi:hypothetical protein
LYFIQSLFAKKVKELNSKFETAVGQTRGGPASGYHPLQEYNLPMLKGKQHFAFMRRRLYVIFK